MWLQAFGLTISNRYYSERICVETELGRGSTFTFTLSPR
jgi:hypothetical protein